MGDSLDDLIALRKNKELQHENAEESKARRAGHRARGALRLDEANVVYQNKNDGAHLIVSHHGLVVDYWPGTGLWRVRTTGESKRGIGSLLARLRRAERGA